MIVPVHCNEGGNSVPAGVNYLLKANDKSPNQLYNHSHEVTVE